MVTRKRGLKSSYSIDSDKAEVYLFFFFNGIFVISTKKPAVFLEVFLSTVT